MCSVFTKRSPPLAIAFTANNRMCQPLLLVMWTYACAPHPWDFMAAIWLIQPLPSIGTAPLGFNTIYISHTALTATLYQMYTSKFYLSIDFMQCLIIAEKDCDWPKRMIHVPHIRALVGLQVMVGEPKRIWETQGGKWNSPVLGAGHCWWSQSWGQHLDCTEWARSFWNMITVMCFGIVCTLTEVLKCVYE